MYRRILLWAFILLIPVMISAGCRTSPERKPAPAPAPSKPAPQASVSTLMDLAAKDPFKDGCVSCHKKVGDVDRSLPAYVKRIAGHPDVKESSVNACYVCHEADKDYNLYKKFTRGIHQAHWKSDIFYGKQKGQCYSCHTVENNGVSGIKNYPLAGYRSGTTGRTAGAGQAQTQKVQPKSVPESKQSTDKTGQSKAPSQENKRGTGTESTTESGNGRTTEVPTPTP